MNKIGSTDMLQVCVIVKDSVDSFEKLGVMLNIKQKYET